jgi:hypothetical protein
LLVGRRSTAITFAAPATLSAIGVVSLRGRRLRQLHGRRCGWLRLLCRRGPLGPTAIVAAVAITSSAAFAAIVALRSWRGFGLLHGRRTAWSRAIAAALTTTAALATIAVVTLCRGCGR